jgi:prevent-host-death family protein
MVTTTFIQLRNNAKKYFDAVEAGETIRVYRHGKPVALLSPIAEHAMDRWKTADILALGISLSRAILEEREESD